ncbi:hypothetical protein HanXRQr2_Chr10g0463051 [Helianthus annuus]|uniref:Uncharacterized protein n=1 Tax=Helianthus annuus TaxID=4232 RepID=A0A251TQK8_HELAN|nr:uncharacterized protein LOC110883477 [Helianthus annuus]KAF5788348.1 hypothetical protein HanXRQr2_Chr10g0463051 [Helianthus annuus]KAJ0885585.1 hypothetical protein HanPSC8_Chr10g0446861 [Helianthus annuus]
MEADEGRKVQVGGEQEEGLVETQSSSASAAATAAVDQMKGKRPHEDLPTSASAPSASSGTKSQVEGAKRPCVEQPNYTVMDDTADEEECPMDMGIDDTADGGYFLSFEGNRMVIVAKRPPPVRRRFGPPHPNAITYKRMSRRMAETGLSYIRGDDPVFHMPWNPFPVASYTSSLPPTATPDASDIEA